MVTQLLYRLVHTSNKQVVTSFNIVVMLNKSEMKNVMLPQEMNKKY